MSWKTPFAEFLAQSPSYENMWMLSLRFKMEARWGWRLYESRLDTTESACDSCFSRARERKRDSLLSKPLLFHPKTGVNAASIPRLYFCIIDHTTFMQDVFRMTFLHIPCLLNRAFLRTRRNLAALCIGSYCITHCSTLVIAIVFTRIILVL